MFCGIGETHGPLLLRGLSKTPNSEGGSSPTKPTQQSSDLPTLPFYGAPHNSKLTGVAADETLSRKCKRVNPL